MRSGATSARLGDPSYSRRRAASLLRPYPWLRPALTLTHPYAPLRTLTSPLLSLTRTLTALTPCLVAWPGARGSILLCDGELTPPYPYPTPTLPLPLPLTLNLTLTLTLTTDPVPNPNQVS